LAGGSRQEGATRLLNEQKRILNNSTTESGMNWWRMASVVFSGVAIGFSVTLLILGELKLIERAMVCLVMVLGIVVTWNWILVGERRDKSSGIGHGLNGQHGRDDGHRIEHN
jgi:hypothetical protein